MMMRLFTAVWAALSMNGIVTAHQPMVGGSKGYSLGIRDSIMIAHSFNGDEFGPAQQVIQTYTSVCYAGVDTIDDFLC